MSDSDLRTFDPKIDTSPLVIAEHLLYLVSIGDEMTTLCSTFLTSFPSIGMDTLLRTQMDVKLDKDEFMVEINKIIAKHDRAHRALMEMVKETYPKEAYTQSPSNIRPSNEAFCAIHDHVSYADFYIKVLQGYYTEPHTSLYVRGKEDMYWWTLDQTRFLQVIMMNALGLVTKSCEEGGFSVQSNVSLEAECLKHLLKFLKPKLQKDGFIIAKVSDTVVDEMENVSGKLFRTQEGEYVWHNSPYFHIMHCSTDSVSGPKSSIYGTYPYAMACVDHRTKYKFFFRDFDHFMIVDPVAGRLADSFDGLFTRIIHHLMKRR